MVQFYNRLSSGRVRLLSFLTALTGVLFYSTSLHAQLGSYTFSQQQGTFEDLQPDSTMGDQNTDDANFSGIDIGFPFRFNNDITEKISISFNGYVVFGPQSRHTFSDAAVSSSNATGRILSANSTTTSPNVAAGFNLDLQSRNGAQFGIKRSGTAPNRVFAVQWKNVKRYGGANSGDNFTFQIRIYETTNVVEFVYGQISFATEPTVTLRAQVGMRGATNQDFVCRTGDSGWLTTSPGANNTDGVQLNSTLVPPPGTTFRYSPIPPAPNDLGVFRILSPDPGQKGCPLTATEKVTLVIRNYGTSNQTSCPVSYKLGNGAEVSQNFTFSPALIPNAMDTITFNSTLDMAAIGTYTLSAYTKLSTELAANKANDTLANYTLQTYPPRNLPFPIATSLSVATANEWKEGTGITTPTGTTSSWTTAFPYPSESIAVTFSSSNTTTNNEWLYSPNLNISQFTFLIFKASVTLNAFGSSPISSMGDDSVQVLVRTNCSPNWTKVTTFSQADVLSGRINNALREFRYPLVSSPSSVIVAFVARGNSTPAAATYRFHLEDIEFKEVSPNDLGVIAVLSPSPGQPGCVLTNAEPVRIVVKNYGSGPQTSIDAGFTVNGANLKTQVFTLPSPILPGDEDTLLFTGTNTANLSAPGTYSINAFTRLASEVATTRFNDTLKNYEVTVTGPQSLPSVLIRRFGDANAASWRRGRGLNAPSGTTSSWGGSFAFPGNETVSLFMSNLAFSPIREWFYSPTFSVTSSTYLFFELAVTSGNLGTALPTTMGDDTLYIKGSTDCGGTWRTIYKFSDADLQSGNISNLLKSFIIPVSSVNTRMTIGLFGDNQGTTNALGYRIHMDNIQIRNVSPNDMGAVRILGPVTNTAYCPQGNAVPVKVVVRNYGTAAQSSASVVYRVNGGAPVMQTFSFSPAIPPTAFDTVEFTGASALDLSAAGSYSLRAYTQLAGEDVANAGNDTSLAATVQVLNAETAMPQTFDFNTGTNLPANWYSETGPLYEYGIVDGRGTNLSNSLSAGFFNTNRTSWLHTTRYKLPAPPADLKMSYRFRIVELFRGSPTLLGPQDTVALYISTDCGATFTALDLITLENQVVDSNYVTKTHSLSAYAGQEVSFRFYGKIVRADANICFIDYDDLKIEQITEAEPVLAGNAWKIYPNPAHSFVTVDRPEGKQAGKFSIVNAAGKVIREFSDSETSGTRSRLDLKGLAPGFYHLRFQSQADQWTSKLLVR